MPKKYVWLAAILLLWSAQGLFADTIYMKSGEVIEGKIISNDEGTIVIKEKFGEMGYGEATYQMKNVLQIVTPEERLIITDEGGKTVSLEELKALLDQELGQHNLVTGFSYKKGIYRIRYYYPTFGSEENDRIGVEKNIFKILSIFSKYKIEGFKSIEIEASTVGKDEKGILSNAEIIQKQFKKYQDDPKTFLIGDIEKFIFFDQFYSF